MNTLAARLLGVTAQGPARSSLSLAALTARERLAFAETLADTADAQRRLALWDASYFSGIDRSVGEYFGIETAALPLALALSSQTTSHTNRPTALTWWKDARDQDARDQDDASSDIGLGIALLPLVRSALRDLQAKFPAGATGIADRVISHDFAADLHNRLLQHAMPTLAFSLNTAGVLGTVTGDTPEARYADFCSRLCSPDYRWAILEAFPALMRLLATVTANTVAAWSEMLDRLTQDRGALTEHLGLPADAVLTEVNRGLGDSHYGGRCVAALTFDQSPKVIYKPRSTAAESAFQGLLTWFNAHADLYPLRVLSVIDRGTHGWVEFVETKPCESATDVEVYYRRLGSLLAILHAIDATDMHNENLIASGADPVLVDLETIFQGLALFADPDSPRDRASGRMVNRTGILPAPLVGPNGILDLSGLADGAGIAPFEVPQWENNGRDDVRLRPKTFQMSRRDNLPTLRGEQTAIDDHADAFAAGFAAGYRTIVRNKADLLHSAGPLGPFRTAVIRVIARDTYQYARSLSRSVHPTVLSDVMERDASFARDLCDSSRPTLRDRLVESELEDLRDGDIPYFHRTPADNAIRDSRDTEVATVPGKTAFELVQDRIRAMDETQLGIQANAIQYALATVSMRGGPDEPTGRPPGEDTVSDDALVASATKIAERLADLAIREGECAYWMTQEPINEERYAAQICSYSLYGGAAGIGVFLSYAANSTGNGDYAGLAIQALNACDAAAGEASRNRPIGAFTGLAGVLYAKLHVSAALDDDALLLRDLAPRLREVAGAIGSEEDHDLMAGSAGCLLVALHLYRRTGSPDARALAEACVNRLVETCNRTPGAASWPSRIARRPLLGMSHGTAGIALALAEYAEEFGDSTAARLAADALSYERELYSPHHANWPDLRGDDPHFRWAWCHGAPGVGIARTLLTGHFADSVTESEIAAACASTIATGFGGNHSLCHGDLGNLDLLLLANEQRLARGIAAQVLGDRDKHGSWNCGVAGDVENPSLMVGLAGIGYQLLRLHKPDSVPSVLALQAP